MSKFKPGQSGNPKGRAPGVLTMVNKMKAALSSFGKRHNVSDAHQALLDKVIEQALSGDPSSQKLILDRLQPMPKPRATPVDVPGADAKDNLIDQAKTIIQAVFEGKLTPEEGRGLVSTIHDVARIHESTELVERIEKLEQVLEERDE